MGIVNRRLNYYYCCKNRKKVFSLLRSNDNMYIIYIHKSRQVFFTNSYFRSAWPERLDNLIFVIRVHVQFCESVHFKLVLLYTEVILYMRTCAYNSLTFYSIVSVFSRLNGSCLNLDLVWIHNWNGFFLRVFH